MKIGVSACLIGVNCKYNGGNNYNSKVIEYLKDKEVVAVCPEVLGGLPTPRVPSEIVEGIVTMKDGTIADEKFKKGAELALKLLQDQGVTLCILQSRSPSCGSKEIYDGSFSGIKIPGMGVFARKLKEAQIQIIDAEDL